MAFKPFELNNLLDEYVELAIKKLPDIEQIWLFGSYSNGTANDDSDIDLAVISPSVGYARQDVIKKLSILN
jgi:predicted nucleotidyltransferase